MQDASYNHDIPAVIILSVLIIPQLYCCPVISAYWLFQFCGSFQTNPLLQSNNNPGKFALAKKM
jgi:hypothetical protein